MLSALIAMCRTYSFPTTMAAESRGKRIDIVARSTTPPFVPESETIQTQKPRWNDPAPEAEGFRREILPIRRSRRAQSGVERNFPRKRRHTQPNTQSFWQLVTVRGGMNTLDTIHARSVPIVDRIAVALIGVELNLGVELLKRCLFRCAS